MDFNDLLFRYFGTADIESLTTGAVEAGLEKIQVDFGLETDPGRRFPLWALLHIFGVAPDLDEAFENPEERDAARNFMDMAAGFGEG